MEDFYMSEATLRVTTSMKLDKTAKDEAKAIFPKLGLTMGDAVNLFLHQVKIKNGLPFDVKIPNAVTKQAIEEARMGVNIEDFSIEELQQIRNKTKAT
jgi:DNA-damage-inducible protein J